MAVPGIGTSVRYHISTGVDIVAMVIATNSTWNSDLTTYYGNSGPTSGHVDLITWQDVNNTGGIYLVNNVSEGTSVGEFSRYIAENEDV